LILISFYLKEWEKSKEYLKKIIEIRPEEIKEILKVAFSQKAYQIILEEIFQRRELKLEESLLEVIEDGEVNINWVKDFSAEKKARQTEFLQRKVRKGEKIKSKEQRILELAEKVLSKIEEREKIELKKALKKAREKEALAVSQFEPLEFDELEEAALRAERKIRKRKPKYKEEEQ